MDGADLDLFHSIYLGHPFCHKVTYGSFGNATQSFVVFARQLLLMDSQGTHCDRVPLPLHGTRGLAKEHVTRLEVAEGQLFFI